MEPMMKRIFLFAAVLALGACSPSGDKTDPAGSDAPSEASARVAVADAWCRPSRKGAQAGACYAILVATADDRLTGGATPRAGQLQLHQMTMDDGVMKMGEMRNGLVLPAGRPVPLAPGGAHLMLIGLTQPLTLGDSVPLTLRFAKSPEVTVAAQVRNPEPTANAGRPTS